MHELSIAENLIKIINDQIKSNNVRKILSIKLKIGKLTSVSPNALAFSFTTLSKGTNLEGINLEIESVPIRVRCQRCNRNFILDEPIFICPKCSYANLKVICGRELYVESMEVE